MSKKIILPKPLAPTDETNETKRATERQHEDEQYVSVIVKRNDQAVRHPDDILETAISEGMEQYKRSFISLFLSATAAGLMIGFSVIVVASIAKSFPIQEAPILQRIAMAFVYPLGFIICIMSGTQLFTEHTATAVYPVLDRKQNIYKLVRLWLIVIGGNLAGAFLSSVLIYGAEPIIHAREGYIEIAQHLVKYDFLPLLISSILAGSLMAQGGWLILATPPASSQIICIYIVTFTIGICGLHHSIAGSAEVFTALLMEPSFLFKDALYFISTALLGNLIGGSLFVATLNYAHIKETQINH